ncbi:acetolactate synthase catalytic subunit [Celeribacter baekdonensis]|uniref:acetolactate synthase catalytic subunit n=1 Tax=Celeribacter baekdonensis TaxID=875171 RepID=UPI003A9550CD
MTKVTVADVAAQALKRHGIEIIFGQSNPTALMLAAEKIGIRQLFYRTENAAGVMADAFSRISNRISAVAVQNGPAATLMVAPMAEAMKASIPMVVLVQEVPSSQRDRNAFQELDHTTLFAGVSKWTRRVDDPSRVEDNIDMAMMAANSGRPGPVVLLFPKDVLMMEAVKPMLSRSADLGRFPLDRTRPDPVAISKAAQWLADAENPLVIAGGGVHVSQACDALANLQKIAFLPVATTNMGKGTIDEGADFSLGVAANITGERGPARFHLPLIESADVVLLIGSRTNENGTDAWRLTPPGAKYIHIDIDGQEIGRNYEAMRLLGDARLAIEDLTAALKKTGLEKRKAASVELKKTIAEGRREYQAFVAPVKASDSTPIATERMLAELDALLTPSDIVVADASYASIWVTSYLRARRPGQRFLVPRGLAGLGWGLPLAMGAKLAAPEARVVNISGDGGFAHVWSELETAVRETIPVTTIILNNGHLGYQRHAENFMFGQPTTAIDFAPVDHAAVARAAGADGVTITDPSEISATLKKALNSGKPTVIDMIVDPDAYAPVRLWDGHHQRINAK